MGFKLLEEDNLLKKFSKLIMIEQTFFALPFAYLGVLFAGGGKISQWVLITIALIAARTAGMSFNRVMDAGIDAKNPRTKERLIPSGEVNRKEVWLLGIISSLLLILSSFLLNSLCFYLSFVAVALLLTYSLFKRFSSTSHFYLGIIEAAAPIGGYLAISSKFEIVPFVLGAAIMMWIAGLDIVYSIQDQNFDKKEGLFSIPVKYGQVKAVTISTISYILSISALIAAGIITSKNIPYWVSLICIALIFFKQQKLAREEEIEPTLKDFFLINLYISPILLSGTAMDLFFV